MDQVRRQFHLPDKVVFTAFDSNPKSIRPEGLRITANIQFSNVTFDEYVADLDNKAKWKPVPFISYSPNLGEEYSRDALSWKNLPLPTSLEGKIRKWRLIPADTEKILKGKYFCSVIDTVRGNPLKHNPAAYKWRDLGRSCSESDWPTIGFMGVLDFEKKSLYVVIQFSG